MTEARQPDILQLQKDRTQERALWLEGVHRSLRRYQHICVFCLFRDGERRRHSPHDRCPSIGRDEDLKMKHWQRAMLDTKALEPYTACHYCFCPLVWCPRWERRSGDSGVDYVKLRARDCTYRNIVFPTFILALSLPEFAAPYRERLAEDEFDPEDRDEQLAYLGQAMMDDVGDIKVNYLLWEFSKAVSALEELGEAAKALEEEEDEG